MIQDTQLKQKNYFALGVESLGSVPREVPLARLNAMLTYKSSPKQITELINDVSFFREIPKNLLVETITHVSLRKYPCSQSILFDNHCSGSIYFIADGWIKVCTSGEHSQGNIYSIYGAGEMIGAIAAVENNWHPTEAVTLTPTRVWSIPAKDFISLLNCCPQASIQVAIFASKRLRKLNQYFRFREAQSLVKVVHILLELTGDKIQSKGQRILIPNLLQREIALIGGITRETVTRSLSKLEKRGLILRQGATIEILQLESLRQILWENPG